MKTHALWLCAAVAALAGAGLDRAYAADADASADKPTAAGDSAALEAVVVTAERRATNLQTTAIAASVLTGQDLQKRGVFSVDQLQFAMPSVVINNFGQGIDFNIRGIGKAEHNSQTTTGVITYRDGVATFPGYFQEEPYYDIASLEVLRGPQGTFVGQNATGGAVLVTTNNPQINGGYHGYAAAQAGNYGDLGAQAAINLPISDTLAMRFAFNTEYRNSFYHISGPFTGNPGRLRSGSARIGVLWQPNSQLKVLFKTDYNFLDMGAYPADPANSPNDMFDITSNAHQLATDQFVRSVLRVDYTLENGIDLRSTSGFQRGRTAYDGDLDGTSAGILTFRDGVDETIWSQEFNIVSPDNKPITWVAGAYYQHDTLYFPKGQFDIGLPPGFYDYDLYGTNPKYTAAVFGQASINLSHGLQIQVGARYSGSRTTNHVTVLVPEFGIVVPDEQSLSDHKLTGKVALNWTIDPHNFVYAFVATGSRSGGLNVPSGAVLPAPFKPETVTDYEIGWKSGLFGGRLRTQLGAYYDEYRNFQVSIGNPTNPQISTELNDPSKTRIYGFEAQLEAVFGAFSVDAGLGVMKSELGTFYAVDPRILAVAPCDPLTGPGSPGCLNLTGHRQTYAPNFTLNIGAQYVFTLASGDTITPRINYGHVSSQWATLFENPALGDYLAPRNIVGAQLAWTHGPYTVSLYGTNLTDQHYVAALNSGLRFAGAPRQWGARVLKLF